MSGAMMHVMFWILNYLCRRAHVFRSSIIFSVCLYCMYPDSSFLLYTESIREKCRIRRICTWVTNSCRDVRYYCRLCRVHCTELSAVPVPVRHSLRQFPKVWSIHHRFSNWKVKDDDQKNSLRLWQLIQNFFIAPLYNVKQKEQLELGALLAIRFIIPN